LILAELFSRLFLIIIQGALQSSEENKRLGIPLVIWRDGKVVHVPPEELVAVEVKGNYKTVKKNK